MRFWKQNMKSLMILKEHSAPVENFIQIQGLAQQCDISHIYCYLNNFNLEGRGSTCYFYQHLWKNVF